MTTDPPLEAAQPEAPQHDVVFPDLWQTALDGLAARTPGEVTRELHRQVTVTLARHRVGTCPLCHPDGCCDAVNNAFRLILAWLIDRSGV